MVEPATIEEDLWRRDFSINAMAVSLSPSQWGLLLDPAGGNGDLETGLVRVSHSRSFWDDATRIVRALSVSSLASCVAVRSSAWETFM